MPIKIYETLKTYEGDLVLTFNEETLEQEYKPILVKHQRLYCADDGIGINEVFFLRDGYGE
jgi:hypothetical protein